MTLLNSHHNVRCRLKRFIFRHFAYCHSLICLCKKSLISLSHGQWSFDNLYEMQLQRQTMWIPNRTHIAWSISLHLPRGHGKNFWENRWRCNRATQLYFQHPSSGFSSSYKNTRGGMACVDTVIETWHSVDYGLWLYYFIGAIMFRYGSIVIICWWCIFIWCIFYSKKPIFDGVMV